MPRIIIKNTGNKRQSKVNGDQSEYKIEFIDWQGRDFYRDFLLLCAPTSLSLPSSLFSMQYWVLSTGCKEANGFRGAVALRYVSFSPFDSTKFIAYSTSFQCIYMYFWYYTHGDAITITRTWNVMYQEQRWWDQVSCLQFNKYCCNRARGENK